MKIETAYIPMIEATTNGTGPYRPALSMSEVGGACYVWDLYFPNEDEALAFAQSVLNGLIDQVNNLTKGWTVEKIGH